MRIAILDDYLQVAEKFADWYSLDDVEEVAIFHEHIGDVDRLAELLARFDVILLMRERTPFPGDLINRLDRLRLLVTTGRRNASIDVAAATRRNIVVCGTDGVEPPAAELTWGLILAIARDIPANERSLREGRWQHSLGVGLHGKRLGIIGLGRLGSWVARYGLAFGMEVVAWSENLTRQRTDELGVTLVSKNDLLASSDFITIHQRLSGRTLGLIGAEELALMKPTAYFVNTSRGPIVDEDALLEALRSRSIAGAALDVYDREPLPSNHPLLALDNVVLTPHLGYVTRESFEVFYRGTLDAIRSFQQGAPKLVINPEVLGDG